MISDHWHKKQPSMDIPHFMKSFCHPYDNCNNFIFPYATTWNYLQFPFREKKYINTSRKGSINYGSCKVILGSAHQHIMNESLIRPCVVERSCQIQVTIGKNKQRPLEAVGEVEGKMGDFLWANTKTCLQSLHLY